MTRHHTAIEQPPALTSVQEQMLRSVLAEQRAFRIEQLNGLAHQPTGGTGAATEITAALQSATRFALTEIEQALARLGRGQHGKCVDCGKRISFERLEIIPMTARCAGCQRARLESGTP